MDAELYTPGARLAETVQSYRVLLNHGICGAILVRWWPGTRREHFFFAFEITRDGQVERVIDNDVDGALTVTEPMIDRATLYACDALGRSIVLIAYATEGTEIFAEDDPKYLALIQDSR